MALKVVRTVNNKVVKKEDLKNYIITDEVILSILTNVMKRIKE